VDAVIVSGRSGDDGLSAMGEAWGELSVGKTGDACPRAGLGEDELDAIFNVAADIRFRPVMISSVNSVVLQGSEQKKIRCSVLFTVDAMLLG